MKNSKYILYLDHYIILKLALMALMLDENIRPSQYLVSLTIIEQYYLILLIY